MKTGIMDSLELVLVTNPPEGIELESIDYYNKAFGSMISGGMTAAKPSSFHQ